MERIHFLVITNTIDFSGETCGKMNVGVQKAIKKSLSIEISKKTTLLHKFCCMSRSASGLPSCKNNQLPDCISQLFESNENHGLRYFKLGKEKSS